MTRTVFFSLLCIAALAASPALAGNDKGKGHGKPHAEKTSSHKPAKTDKKDGDTVTIRFGDDTRDVIRTYLGKEAAKNCPPGLAKKNNGCLPPGIAKKYALGQPLGAGIGIPLPRELSDLLGPAPRGHYYAQVDKDVLLVAEATKKVVDAVTLISAVGN